MSNKIQSIRGMKDLFGEDFEIHNHIIETAKKVSNLYCYEGASTPILEYTKVFDRTLGDTSDIVSKEMYSFIDKGKDEEKSVALRPEFTAGIMRAFISNGLQQKIPLKLFSFGPLFRRDRPQAARQRQFHQVNFEYIGSNEPYSDAEIIKLATHLLKKLEIINNVTLEINSLGCQESRIAYQNGLANYFAKYENDLSEDSKNRLQKNNPLRILDSKDENDRKIVIDAPLVESYYTPESRSYFERVLEYLEIFDITYKINPRLVRGLDYYSHTAFEFITDKLELGSQTSIVAGGRYDNLCKLMGGPDVPAVGFAAGIERLALMMEYKSMKRAPIYIISIGEECQAYTIKLANHLRENSIAVSLELYGKVEKRIEKALKNNADYIIFAGSQEMENNNFKLKILANKEENFLSMDELLEFFTEIYE